MTDEERIGREWCDEHGEEPEWYEPLGRWYWQLGPMQGDINRQWFPTESDAYAAIGAALREMRAVVEK